ncbi:hypothetical protein R3P82_17245 [Dietzia maris]|uniref:Uncharacterized protein n=1 Tax=Dietzia maris TaxID=37915 RepID=A0AAE4QYS9_9ACTN|nr:hypothetical protein [Dietzia maris]MDV6300859.1 hypothetical protein [Dietzia maris]
MNRLRGAHTSLSQTFALAARGLRTWTVRQIVVATAVALGFGIVLGVATVLIPNSVFTREIPPVWWNYPVWILTSAFSGMLFATYVRSPANSSQPGVPDTGINDEDPRASRAGMVGAFLAWFAVGCPVCNKFALLALGYSGAITWFAPFQPVLAIAALALTGVALVVRLRGQVACGLPAARAKEPVT